MNPRETIPRSRTVETRILWTECHFERSAERRRMAGARLAAKDPLNKYFSGIHSEKTDLRLREFDPIIALLSRQVYPRIFANHASDYYTPINIAEDLEESSEFCIF